MKKILVQVNQSVIANAKFRFGDDKTMRKRRLGLVSLAMFITAFIGFLVSIYDFFTHDHLWIQILIFSIILVVLGSVIIFRPFIGQDK